MNRALRIARLPKAELVSVPFGSGTLLDQHPRLYALLRQHLSAQIASTFAEAVPSADGQMVEFYSDLNGQPLPFTQAPAPLQAKVSQTLQDRLQTVRQLADRLAAQGQKDEAALLRAAAVTPEPRFVAIVGDHPVISNWGSAGRLPTPAPAATATTGTAAATVAAGGMRWLWPLLLLLLLLLLAGLLWWWFNTRFHMETPPPEVPASVPDATVVPEDPNAALREKIARLEADLAARLAACPKPEPLPAPVPDVTPEPPPLPDPVPLPEITAPEKKSPEKKAEKPPEKPVEKPAEKPVEKPAEKAPAKTAAKGCPDSRQSWEAPEVVFLVDGSGSMADRGTGGRTRMDEAKTAVRDALKTLPSDVDAGLLTFGDCAGIDNYNFFKASERPRLQGHVDRLSPQNATPLARGLQRAGNMVDGNSVDSVLVVVSDGDDTCGGDPCAVARALKAQKPRLTINVVDVGDGKAACIAKATGGKVFTPRNPAELDDMIKRATGQPTNCR